MLLKKDISGLTIGEKVRALRLHAGLTGRALAEQMGIDNARISRLENGWIYRLGEYHEIRMCEILGCERSDIWG